MCASQVLRRPDKSSFVVRQESFDGDVEALLDWLCVPPEKRVPPTKWNSDRAEAPPSAIHDDTDLTDVARKLLEMHMQADYYAKATVEALADNAPSALAAAWARPPPLEGKQLECSRACGLLSDFVPKGLSSGGATSAWKWMLPMLGGALLATAISLIVKQLYRLHRAPLHAVRLHDKELPHDNDKRPADHHSQAFRAAS